MGHKGSPPRVRGRAYVNPKFQGMNRITPARAGKSLPWSFPRCTCKDHPRACGEESCLVPKNKCFGGSPPRVRGRADLVMQFCLKLGITPARAGKRAYLSAGSVQVKDHPRACGEEKDTLSSRLKVQGSPPRVRGRDLCRSKQNLRARITPARAGKSGCSIWPCCYW